MKKREARNMELAEYLDTFVPAPEESDAERQPFVVDSMEKAEWALRKLKRVRQQRAENRKLAEEEIGRIEMWLRGEEERLQQDEDYFCALLADYHQRILQEDPKAKTVRLPHGVLKMRAQQPEFKRDEDKLLAWLDGRGIGELVRVKREPDWQKIKPLVAATGSGAVVWTETSELVEGVRAETRPPKFTVETDAD